MKNFKQFNEANQYSVIVEFEGYDENGDEVLDDRLYSELTINGNDEEEILDKLYNMDFDGRIISYVEIEN
jgi:hypothetical protein